MFVGHTFSDLPAALSAAHSQIRGNGMNQAIKGAATWELFFLLLFFHYLVREGELFCARRANLPGGELLELGGGESKEQIVFSAKST